MISVIVPVYNVQNYIKQCLDSIINQTYKGLEIILVDDGSTDNSGVICDEYAKKDSRVKVIHKQNGGLSTARNAGLDVANGEFITFVDSDDTIEFDTLDCLFSALKDADVAICKARIVKDGEILKRTEVNHVKSMSNDDLWNEIFYRLTNSACGKLYRKSIIVGCRFPEGLCHGEDLIFHLQYLPRDCKGVFIEAEKYNYFKRENSITTQKKFTEKAFDEIKIKDMAFEIIKEKKPEYYDKALSYCFLARLNLCRKIYKFNKAKEYAVNLNEYNRFFKSNYSKIKHFLKKRKIEYLVYRYAKCIYKLFVGMK